MTPEVLPTLKFSAEVWSFGGAETCPWASRLYADQKVRVWNLIPLISFRGFVLPARGRESGGCVEWVWSGWRVDTATPL